MGSLFHMPESYFSPKTLKFLSALTLNNNREWFALHRDDYEELVREPALRLIRNFAPGLKKISSHLLAVDKKVGGSLIRVQRDARFSANKSPYKTNIGIQFRHKVGRDIHAPVAGCVDPREVGDSRSSQPGFDTEGPGKESHFFGPWPRLRLA
jgi:uncharacterized protein (DUF2461 family)